MLEDFAERIKKLLPSEIQLFRLMLRETVTSYAEWFAEDNE
jgi:6-pyruvoyltetrahydropterin/6-carboxytetrahydropterin synthase